MTVVKRYTPDQRVPKLLRRKGGMTAEQAVAAAEANLDVIRDQSLAEVDKAIAAIEAQNRLFPRWDDLAAIDTAHAQANQVLAMAGVFGLDELGEAAWSLCELLMRFKARGVGDSRAVTVHLEGFRLLRNEGDETAGAMRRQIVIGLQKVVERYEG